MANRMGLKGQTKLINHEFVVYVMILMNKMFIKFTNIIFFIPWCNHESSNISWWIWNTIK